MKFYKHVKWRSLQQYLTIVAVNYCCKALHIRCLQGLSYASAISVKDFVKKEEALAQNQLFADALQNKCSKTFRKIYLKTPVLDSSYNKRLYATLLKRDSSKQKRIKLKCRILEI